MISECQIDGDGGGGVVNTQVVLVVVAAATATCWSCYLLTQRLKVCKGNPHFSHKFLPRGAKKVVAFKKPWCLIGWNNSFKSGIIGKTEEKPPDLIKYLSTPYC